VYSHWVYNSRCVSEVIGLYLESMSTDELEQCLAMGWAVELGLDSQREIDFLFFAVPHTLSGVCPKDSEGYFTRSKAAAGA
jgi:hypothetical protein